MLYFYMNIIVKAKYLKNEVNMIVVYLSVDVGGQMLYFYMNIIVKAKYLKNEVNMIVVYLSVDVGVLGIPRKVR
jgi:hypothetical protein